MEVPTDSQRVTHVAREGAQAKASSTPRPRTGAAVSGKIALHRERRIHRIRDVFLGRERPQASLVMHRSGWVQTAKPDQCAELRSAIPAKDGRRSEPVKG